MKLALSLEDHIIKIRHGRTFETRIRVLQYIFTLWKRARDTWTFSSA